jgi:hypothetical protein
VSQPGTSRQYIRKPGKDWSRVIKITPDVKSKTPLRIFRCERCSRPCMLTRLDNEEMKFCPVDQKPVDWKLLNRDEKAVCAT